MCQERSVLSRFSLLFAVALTMMVSGCKEADYAIDIITGARVPSLLASAPISPIKSLLLRETNSSGSLLREVTRRYEREASPLEFAQSVGVNGQERRITITPDNIQPELPTSSGNSEPRTSQAMTIKTIKPYQFTFLRDPFMPPSDELIPTDCPPSMPLCRFDYTQLKLRGLIKSKSPNGKEEYKGMVEDPDGRGYFITAGTQVRGATVTQVTNKGVVLYVHKTKKLDWLIMEGAKAKGS
ncbi:MAG: hypothetical protein QG577_1936 [Thermodesulfobacteriota bacterium]|nr:hypothetical protein [Thermodesulfobacteriota bacterium]